MNILKLIILDVINFWYIFFDHPKLPQNTVIEIDNKIHNIINLPRIYYSISWKISRWKIFPYHSCDCNLEYNKKVMLKIFVKPNFSVYYSQIFKGIYCLKCKEIYIEELKDLD